MIQIWHDSITNSIRAGEKIIRPLCPLHREILKVFIDHQGVYLTKTELISKAWPEDVALEGVSDAALQQQICTPYDISQTGRLPNLTSHQTSSSTHNKVVDKTIS